MSIDPDEMYEWRRAMDCTPIFDTDEMTYNRRCRIDDLAPDRTVGVLAAYEYLEGRAMKLNMGIAIPAIGILIIALCLAVVAWAVR